MSVLVPNVLEGAPVLRPPQCRLEMVFDGGRRRAYADDPTELLALLISGYGGSDEQRLQQRVDHALITQVRAQARFVAADWDGFAHASPQQRAALTSTGHEPVVVEVWDGPVPLVVVDVLYEPVTPGVALPLTPDGDVTESWWLRVLRPADEWDYLASLATAEVIRLGVMQRVAS